MINLLKNKKHVKLDEMFRNDYHTTGNALHYLYHQKHYKLIGIDLLIERNTSIPQQINFVEKLEEDNRATRFVIPEKQQKSYSKFFFRFIKRN